MSAFVLIILFNSWGGDGGVQVREIGFGSMETCAAARAALLSEARANGALGTERMSRVDRVTAVCVKR